MTETEVKKRNKIILWIMILLLVVAAIVAAVNLMQYNRRQKEIIRLTLEREELQYRVDELKYRLDSPIDDAYVERVAREKLGLYFPDEIIYYNNTD